MPWWGSNVVVASHRGRPADSPSTRRHGVGTLWWASGRSGRGLRGAPVLQLGPEQADGQYRQSK